MKRFVYSLLDGNNVFYIGCTTDICKRYRQHLQKVSHSTQVNKYIQQMINEGRYPEINILYHLPEVDAYFKEAEVISAFSRAGHILTNFQYNNHRKHKLTIKGRTNRRDILKIIKNRQETYLFFHDNRNEDGSQKSFQYPLEPVLKEIK